MSVPTEASGALLDLAREAPAITVGELTPPGGLLLVIPHPDDETLGCGAALAAAADLDRDIMLVLVTEGEASHAGSRSTGPAALRAIRRAEFETALGHLTSGRQMLVERLGLPDGRSDPGQLSDARFAELVRSAHLHGVCSIWTTWRDDPHCDHRTAADIAIRLARRLGARLWQFPVWGRFGEPRHLPRDLRRFAGSSPIHAERKRRAIHAYKSQLTPMITDDPYAFLMPAALVAHFERHPELFIGE